MTAILVTAAGGGGEDGRGAVTMEVSGRGVDGKRSEDWHGAVRDVGARMEGSGRGVDGKRSEDEAAAAAAAAAAAKAESAAVKGVFVFGGDGGDGGCRSDAPSRKRTAAGAPACGAQSSSEASDTEGRESSADAVRDPTAGVDAGGSKEEEEAGERSAVDVGVSGQAAVRKTRSTVLTESIIRDKLVELGVTAGRLPKDCVWTEEIEESTGSAMGVAPSEGVEKVTSSEDAARVTSSEDTATVISVEDASRVTSSEDAVEVTSSEDAARVTSSEGVEKVDDDAPVAPHGGAAVEIGGSSATEQSAVSRPTASVKRDDVSAASDADELTGATDAGATDADELTGATDADELTGATDADELTGATGGGGEMSPERQRVTTDGDGSVSLMLSHVASPWRFWAHSVTRDAQEAIAGLMEHLAAYHADCAPACCAPRDVRPAQLYAARYPDDDRYYRARVDRLRGDGGDGGGDGVAAALVYYIDFGNSEWLPLSRLFPLELLFRMLPAQAICCRLANVTPRDARDGDDGRTDAAVDEATDAFLQMTGFSKTLLGYVDGVHSPTTL